MMAVANPLEFQNVAIYSFKKKKKKKAHSSSWIQKPIYKSTNKTGLCLIIRWLERAHVNLPIEAQKGPQREKHRQGREYNWWQRWQQGRRLRPQTHADPIGPILLDIFTQSVSVKISKTPGPSMLIKFVHFVK